MKKRAILRSIVLFALILLIIVAMYQPQAYWVVYGGLSTPPVYCYEPESFFSGSWWNLTSYFLALFALLLTPFTVKYRACSRICGSLLLLSAAAIVYHGIRWSFGWFTPLTWGIVAALTVLGLWTLLAFHRKPKEKAEESASTAT